MIMSLALGQPMNRGKLAKNHNPDLSLVYKANSQSTRYAHRFDYTCYTF